MKHHQPRALAFQSFVFMSFIVLGEYLATAPGVSYMAHAQIVTSITPTTGSGNLGTTVLQAESSYNITGGTRAGTSLFHSFGNFSVGVADTANFLNTPVNGSLPVTSNILGRVTGGNPSNIFGTLQTTGFGSANLFLMNPAGIVFGPHASLNVGGSAHFTTADYLRLADGAHFNAIPGPLDAAISSAPVAAFGFLGSNLAAITVQGGQFAVLEGHSISLVGGKIEVTAAIVENGTSQPALIAAPGGQINFASVASSGEVLASSFEPTPAMTLGSVTLSQGSVLDVSANSAGTIRIRGGQLVIADGTLSADTGDTNGAPIGIDLKITGDLSIVDTRGIPAIAARAAGSGDAGAIQITSGNLMATSSFVDPNFLPTTLIDSHSSGDGRGGDVRIATGDLVAVGPPETNGFNVIESGTRANGRGGNITIDAQSVDLDAASISTGQLVASALVSDTSTVNGAAGNLTVTTDTLRTRDSILDTSAFLGTSTFQKGGDITIAARDISMVNTQVTSISTDGAGDLTIRANTLVTDLTTFELNTISGQGGAISVETGILELTNGSAMISSTLGEGTAGSIRISATDHVSIIGDLGTNPLAQFQPSGLFSNSFGRIFETLGGQGNAGNIIVTTPRLQMNGGRINTVTSSSGSGGNVTLNVRDSITISGEFASSPDIIPSIFDIGPLTPSGIVTQTIGGEFCSGPCGNAGNIVINTGSVNLGNGGQINSGTSSSGQGGNITVNARDSISINGTLSNGQPAGMLSRTIGTEPDAGKGGNISLTAGQSVSLSNGATVSASSTGPADAGNIAINAGSQFMSQNASVTTEASQASGGNIVVQATDSIRLVNSTISTSVQGGPETSGGNITIDPTFMTLQNSQILAQAVQGQGGNINIVAGTFLMDPTSIVSASSQFGLSGAVNIQSPISMLSGTLATLPRRPLQVQHLLQQRCAAQVNGQLSSLVVAGRDTLPYEPGGWLMSSMALLAEDVPVSQPPLTSDDLVPSPQTMIVSGQLYERRTPSAQQGATSWAGGCGS